MGVEVLLVRLFEVGAIGVFLVAFVLFGLYFKVILLQKFDS